MRELTQTFRFPGATSDQLAEILATAPLVGASSIFGDRKVTSSGTDNGVRRATRFEPAPIPLLKFDVEIQQHAGERAAIQVVLEFAQPNRRRPYLAGQFVWLLEDESDTVAVLREEINTPEALRIVERPLHGSPLSFRRWLFFAGGHQRLMKDVAGNLRDLLTPTTGRAI